MCRAVGLARGRRAALSVLRAVVGLAHGHIRSLQGATGTPTREKLGKIEAQTSDISGGGQIPGNEHFSQLRVVC